jgi:redox-sensitive bicupin YhaK (pirin superfamily)
VTTFSRFVIREVERIVSGTPVSDGGGVRLLRVLTPDLQRRFDPFAETEKPACQPAFSC